MHTLRMNEIVPILNYDYNMTVNLSSVVELMVVDDLLTVPEGGTVFICVNVTNSLQLRETDIILTYTITEGNNFTSMLYDTGFECFNSFLF
jgi:hypothetical protein